VSGDNKMFKQYHKLFLIILFLLLTGCSKDYSTALHSINTVMPERLPAQEPLSETVFVDRVVDGDTIVVVVQNATKLYVRLIGVDTPESVSPKKGVECFGVNASDFLKSYLSYKTVVIRSDLSQDDKDRYGRLLRYVIYNDTNVNALLIGEGYGREYTYRVPYQFQQQFKLLEQHAREQSKGLWGWC
jgi:micrococcal nuclease